MCVCIPIFVTFVAGVHRGLGHKDSHLPFRGSALTQVCMYVHACVFMCCVFLCVHVLCDIPFLCYPRRC